MSIKLWIGQKKYDFKQWLKSKAYLIWAIITTVLLVAGAWYFSYRWLETEILKVQFPQVQLNLIPKAQAKEVQPEEVEVITGVDHLVSGIYQLESSNGKNDKCVRKGKGFNGYGFGQSLTKDNCYSSHEEVRELVVKWIQDKEAKGFSEGQLLCYYNTGHKVSTCSYYQSYKNLK